MTLTKLELLIGTRNALVLWNGQKNIVSNGNYYGVTWNKEYVYCSYNPPNDQVSKINVFDKKLNFKHALNNLDFLSGVHQILVSDAKLHITFTNANTIVVIDGEEIKRLNWTKYKGDQHHFNSLWKKNDAVYIAESGLRNNVEGELLFPTIQVLNKDYSPTSRIVIPEAIHIHNVYIENEQLYCCGKYGLIQHDIKSSTTYTIDLRRDKENGFFRGLARTSKHWYIGESQELPRAKRSYGDAEILVLDNNFAIVDIIELKDTGQVQDFRVINELDLAHNEIGF